MSTGNGSPTCPDLLSPYRVDRHHEWFPPACAALGRQVELRRLVADPCAVVIDGRLVVPADVRGDPGGFPV